MDKNPKQLHKAIKYVKDAVNNGEAIYGKLQSQAGIKRVSLSNLETDLHADLHTGYDIRSAQRQQMKRLIYMYMLICTLAMTLGQHKGNR